MSYRRENSDCMKDDMNTVKNSHIDETKDTSIKSDPNMCLETPKSSTTLPTMALDGNSHSERKSGNASNDMEAGLHGMLKIMIHELHSMNFLHTGCSKTLYAVPGDYAFSFEEVIRTEAYGGNIDHLDLSSSSKIFDTSQSCSLQILHLLTHFSFLCCQLLCHYWVKDNSSVTWVDCCIWHSLL
ncbi:hypothetical protein PTKIN_Ptkin16aG0113600 [Pterospermum kingtungense]